MTTLLTEEAKIAVGYNNAAGLVLFTSIVPSGDRAFTEPLELPHYNPGIAKVRGTGMSSRAGFPSTRHLFGYWTLPQYLHLQVTFCGGEGFYEGFVTVRTRIGGSSAANYNAILKLPTPDEMEYQGQHYLSPVITYTRMKAL